MLILTLGDLTLQKLDASSDCLKTLLLWLLKQPKEQSLETAAARIQEECKVGQMSEFHVPLYALL